MSASAQPLTGRVVIVTGAGRGAGAAAALALAGAGARLVTGDVNPDRAERAAQDILAAGGTAFGWQVDVSNKFQVAALIETARDRYGRLDIFVQHAHINPRCATLTMDEWDWRRTLEVNLTGSFFCMQLAGRVMADEGGGLIALLVRPVTAAPMAAYAATQAALTALAGSLAAEWGDRGVRVAAIPATSPDAAVRQLLSLCSPSPR
jgi:NAD(P)-dependent dehydrogenase (short-subunit alcohol dehydrogenase family)